MSHYVDDGVWYDKYCKIARFKCSEGGIIQAMADCLTDHTAIDNFNWFTASQVFGFDEGVCDDVCENGWDMSDDNHVQLYEQIQDFLTPLGPIDLDEYL